MLHVESISWRAYFKHYEFISTSKSHNFIANFKGFTLAVGAYRLKNPLVAKELFLLLKHNFLILIS